MHCRPAVAPPVPHVPPSRIARVPPQLPPRRSACPCRAAPQPTDPCLPPGPWLRSLRRLTLPANMAAASLPVLAGATQLSYLAALRVDAAQPTHCALPAALVAQLPAGARPAAVQRRVGDTGRPPCASTAAPLRRGWRRRCAFAPP